MKGAPEAVLHMCAQQGTAAGLEPLDRPRWHEHVEALADSGPCSGLGVECRRIAEGFAFERIAHRYLEIYQSMLSMRSGRSAR